MAGSKRLSPGRQSKEFALSSGTRHPVELTGSLELQLQRGLSHHPRDVAWFLNSRELLHLHLELPDLPRPSSHHPLALPSPILIIERILQRRVTVQSPPNFLNRAQFPARPPRPLRPSAPKRPNRRQTDPRVRSEAINGALISCTPLLFAAESPRQPCLRSSSRSSSRLRSSAWTSFRASCDHGTSGHDPALCAITVPYHVLTLE